CTGRDGAPRELLSFPTRRSSDLVRVPPAHRSRRRDRDGGVDGGVGAAPGGSPGAVHAVLGAGQADPGGGEQRRRGAVVRHLGGADRKSTRLNSSHVKISYAVFCL